MNTTMTVDFEHLGDVLASGGALSAPQLRALAHSRDLIGLGMLAAEARTRRHGTRGTFVRVHIVEVGFVPADAGGFGLDLPEGGATSDGTFEMGELRLAGRPASLALAQTVVAAAASQAAVPVTGWSVEELGALGPIADVARGLKEAGLHAVATARLDRLGPADLDALAAAALPVQTVTLGTPLDGDGFLEALERLRAWQAATGIIRACAPLPVETTPEQPTTGYDDMRHVAVARLALDNVEHIQAHWQRMGAKLSQSCLLFGADDLDAVPAHDPMPYGRRRAILEEVRRNFVAASLTPAERDGAWAVGRGDAAPGAPVATEPE